jgi:uncharacterized protein YndB with AHSA1/START domain
MSNKHKIKREVVVETTPELAFEAVTGASELREWFGEQAWSDVRPGGRYEVRWGQEERVEGRFVELQPPRRAAITWQRTGDPGKTSVEFAIRPTDDGVKVTLVHGGFGSGPRWDKALARAKSEWSRALENLKSTLETGVDLRLARRPFLGIRFDTLDAERAAKEGIAVEKGIYLNDTVEGSGAREAGLGKGDVIVAVGGVETPGVTELVAALRAGQVGDAVDVDVVHGKERRTVRVVLGQRLQEKVPETTEAAAQFLAGRYQESDAELKAAVEGLMEAEAERCPAAGEWSVKQVLAHLSIAERDVQSYLGTVALAGWEDDGPHNPSIIPGRLAAVLAVTPTLKGLLERFLADEQETVAFVRGLPVETVAHKARFYRIGQNVTYFADHVREHVEQIKKTVEAVRGG